MKKKPFEYLPDPNISKDESLPVASGNGETGIIYGVKLPTGDDKKVSINTHLNKYKSVFLMDKELIIFLKRNKAYSKFMRNLTYENIEELNDAVVLANERGVITTPIKTAFIWNRTDEGYDYWNTLNAMFEGEYYALH